MIISDKKKSEKLLLGLIKKAIREQMDVVAEWHKDEPDEIACLGENDEKNFIHAVLVNHLMNYKLWHVEDICRRDDVNAELLADCKRQIDKLNQQRTDAFELADECLVKIISPLLPQHVNLRYNSESLGMILDRLSILALKIYHMNEEVGREGVTIEHSTKCKIKLESLLEQRHDLEGSMFDLISDYLQGNKCPKTRYSFKMYNDPTLNPQLYGNKK